MAGARGGRSSHGLRRGLSCWRVAWCTEIKSTERLSHRFRGGGHGRSTRKQASLEKSSIVTTTELHSQSSARPTFRASPVSRASAESCQQLRPWDLDPPLGRSVALFARRPRPCSRASGSGGTPPFGFALLARAFGGLRTCWTGSSADADDDDDSAVCTDAYRLRRLPDALALAFLEARPALRAARLVEAPPSSSSSTRQLPPARVSSQRRRRS